ncbi:MAG: hypothetical protein J07HQX50_02309 [Haloquadratum sp. J07HQX50]|nr:MAG: hypothetical protein J07HQX50_02309 [Haloquadratum sp. J07HQX50]
MCDTWSKILIQVFIRTTTVGANHPSCVDELSPTSDIVSCNRVKMFPHSVNKEHRSRCLNLPGGNHRPSTYTGTGRHRQAVSSFSQVITHIDLSINYQFHHELASRGQYISFSRIVLPHASAAARFARRQHT